MYGRFWVITEVTQSHRGTTWVIRIYQQTGDKVKLLHRVDWELPGAVDDDHEKLARHLAPLAAKVVTHIIVKGLRKGAVFKKLVNWLAGRFPSAAWFISSKAWQPNWLLDSNLLHHTNVKLVLIPQLAIYDGSRQGRITSSPWITSGGQASDEALSILDKESQNFPSGLLAAKFNVKLIEKHGAKWNVFPART